MKNVHRAGLLVAASIPLLILPARIAEGQWNNPVNLVGSEIVIFLMGLACWYAIILIQNTQKLPWIIKILLSVLACCIFSNVFFFLFNPYFQDFPFRTVENPLPIRILMLSSRGILMSMIIIPAAYYLKRDHEAKKARAENQRLLMEKFQIQNTLLEQTVSERTYALQEALSYLQKSQNELEHQFFIQSRLIASITHDIRGPFKFLIQVSEEVSKLAANKGDETLKLYSRDLSAALENMFEFVKNLLEYTKLPLKEKVSKSQTVNLDDLISEKYNLFKGIIQANNNELIVDVDKNITVKSNRNLLGIILHNLIDNANRYTRSGKIELSVQKEEQNTVLSLKNKGFVIQEHIVAYINADNNSDNYLEEQRKKQDMGIGLVLIKDVSNILDVRVSVQSDDDATIFKLTFSDDHILLV
jgi:signal transduction histidine kinase